ncbi:MAG: PAS domain S-box protein [Methanomicrobiaceae archaeon]|nr:PAS domain S-box protein [Methanomicrobiaceae archaeon]
MEEREGDSPGAGSRMSAMPVDSFFGEDFYEMLFMNANVWIAFIDDKSRVVSWNRAAERISGYMADEVIGSSEIWKKLYPDPGYRKTVTKKIINTIANKQALEKLETRIRCRNGKSRIISWNTKEILDNSGELRGYFIIGLDITDIVKLQASFQAILMNANVLIAFIDPKARIVVWNRFAEKISGYLADEVTGSNEIWKKLYPDPEYRKYVTEEIKKNIDSGQSLETFESEIQTKSGDKKTIFWNTKALNDFEENLSGYIIIGLDLTREKEMQGKIFEYIGQAVVRMKFPVEIIRDNLLELDGRISSGEIETDDILLDLRIQIKSAEQILNNLYDLNQAVQNSFDEMPEDMKKFLLE